MNATPRLKRVLMYQFIAMIFNVLLMAWVSMSAVDWLAPQLQQGGTADFILRYVLVVGMTMVTSKWLNNLSLVLINMVVYAGNLEEAAEEALSASATPPVPPSAATTEVVDFTIIGKPDTPCARYQDAEIFEWLDVKGEDGVVQRLLFEGTVDMKRGLPNNIEPGTLLLPPGILYKFAQQ